MESIELFEYNQLCKPIEDQTNNTSNIIEIYLNTCKYIGFQMKIQYYPQCVAKNCVI